MELKDKLLNYRVEHNLSCDELAEKCKITRQTIYNILNGKQKPSLFTTAKIEKILNGEGE